MYSWNSVHPKVNNDGFYNLIKLFGYVSLECSTICCPLLIILLYLQSAKPPETQRSKNGPYW